MVDYLYMRQFIERIEFCPVCGKTGYGYSTADLVMGHPGSRCESIKCKRLKRQNENIKKKIAVPTGTVFEVVKATDLLDKAREEGGEIEFIDHRDQSWWELKEITYKNERRG